jgi:hypothetical protein
MLSAAPTLVNTFFKNLCLFCKQNNHLTGTSGIYRRSASAQPAIVASCFSHSLVSFLETPPSISKA